MHVLELMTANEELEGERAFGFKVASWEGGPKFNEPEALKGGAEPFRCCQAIAEQGSFAAKLELSTFVVVNFEKVVEGLMDVQK